MGQRQIEVDQRKARLDLRGRFIVKPRERKLTGIEIEIAEIVMRLDVSRLMLQRQREIIQRFADVAQVLTYDAEVAISLGNVVAIIYRLQIRLDRLRIVL